MGRGGEDIWKIEKQMKPIWDLPKNELMPSSEIRVDYETQKRTVKDSGEWYAEVIRTNQITE